MIRVYPKVKELLSGRPFRDYRRSHVKHEPAADHRKAVQRPRAPAKILSKAHDYAPHYQQTDASAGATWHTDLGL